MVYLERSVSSRRARSGAGVHVPRYWGSSASDFRGPKSPDLRKQAQENAAMIKQAMYPRTTSTSSSVDPMPKEVAEQKPVNTKRVKKRESQPGSPRPKSWHTDLRAASQPDLSRMPQHQHRTGDHSHPRYRNPPPTQFNKFYSSPDSSFMKSTDEEQTSYHPHGRSTGNLNNNSAEDRIEPLPGHVQKKREVFERTILSQSMDKINSEEYGDVYIKRSFKGKETITHGVNPKLRNIGHEIEPVEIYPKVVVAKHIDSVQSKAVLGRVPDSSDQKGQKYGGAQDVNIYAVQMPTRQIASSADSSVTRNYAQAHSNLSGHPQTSYVRSSFGANPHSGSYASHQVEVRKVPPAIPKREDSKTKTQAYSDHVKSSSWPVSTISSETTSTLTVCPTIQPSDLPPVKLIKTEKGQRSPSQSNLNQNSNSTTQDLVMAKPIWIDDASEPEFNFEDNKLRSSENTLNTNMNPPSPPVRDNDDRHSKLKLNKTARSSDDRYNTSDHLIQDYLGYLETTEQQQENLKTFQPESSVPESNNTRHHLSKTQDFRKAAQQEATEPSPMAQTLPVRDNVRYSWLQERRKQRKRSSLSSDDSFNFEFELNKKNLGQNSSRTWRNPSDNRSEERQPVVKSPTTGFPAQPTGYPQQFQQQQAVESKISSHSRQSSDLDNPNAPRNRTPISPSLLEETFGMNQEPEQKTFTEKVERTVNRQESRDSRKSGIFDQSNDCQIEKLQQGSDLSENSILSRLKREGSFKSNVNLDPERSEGNETSARKIIPDTKRDLRNLGHTDDVFQQDHRPKGNHYKSGSFTHDTRGNTGDPRLMKTAPVLSSHQRTHSIDTYNRNPQRRHESSERRGNPVSRENSFSERNLADKQGYWEAKSQDHSGEHKKSKSDSDQHPKADQHRKKMSDPVNKPQNVRKTSDPESRQQIWDALKGYMHQNRRSPPGTSPASSRPPSMSGSEQSLCRSDIYHSNTSLASGYSSSRHYPQDSTSSFGSSFSHPLHQPQDSGFGSNSDISRVCSPHSPPQTGVVSPKDIRIAASISRSSSVSSPAPQYQTNNERSERRKSHQVQRPHPTKPLKTRMSLDSNIGNYRNHPDKLRSNIRSPQEKLEPSPTRQISPSSSYNVHVAERVPISILKEEEITKDGPTVYESLQMDHTETEANHRVFRFPPSKMDDRTTSNSGGQRTPPKISSLHPPISNLTTDPSNQEPDISPPPPPTPLTPLDVKSNMEFPPPPPELVPAANKKRRSPKQEPSGQTVKQATQEGSMPPPSTERISPSFTEQLQQAPSLEVQVEAAPLAKVEETTPSISPNSNISGRSSPDNHDIEPATSPQQVRLPSVQEDIAFPDRKESPVPTRPTTLVGSPLRHSRAEPEPLDVPEDEEEEEAFDACDSGLSKLQEKTDKELREVSDPVVKWVLQVLTPSDTVLADLFPLPKSKESRSGSETFRMTMDATTPTKSESEMVSEPSSPSECVNLVLSSSRYLRISPAKAIILKRAQTMNKSDDLGNNNTELRKTQEELVDRISKKLDDIKDLQKEVADEMSNLEDMGRKMMDSVKANCKASEYNKCNMYIADIERVTKLLLSLSRRLSKVDSVLGSMENSEEEEKTNLEKLKVTMNSQYQDAKMLKESITHRHSAISSMLLDKISNDQHDNFTYYIQMLPRHLIMGQELDDKVKLGEEQLEALSESLKQMSLSSESGGSRDTNGNVHSYKEEGAITSSSSSIGISGPDELNSNATSSYC